MRHWLFFSVFSETYEFVSKYLVGVQFDSRGVDMWLDIVNNMGGAYLLYTALDLRKGDVEMGERSGKLPVRSGKRGSYRETPLTLDAHEALGTYLDKERSYNEDRDVSLWIGPYGMLRHRSIAAYMLEKYAIHASSSGRR